MPQRLSRSRALYLAYRMESVLAVFGWRLNVRHSKTSCSIYVTARMGKLEVRTRISDHKQRRGRRWITVGTLDEVLMRARSIVELGIEKGLKATG